MKRTLETDQALWILFVVAAVLGMVLDRMAARFMATWGWVLILIALGAGLAALAWPLLREHTSAEPKPIPPLTIEPVAETADPPSIQDQMLSRFPEHERNETPGGSQA